jgi:hypothetical protein
LNNSGGGLLSRIKLATSTLSTEGQTILAPAACQKENDRISTIPLLLSHFSSGDKIENCPAQFLAVCWIVCVEFKLHHLRDGFSVSNARLLNQSARLSRKSLTHRQTMMAKAALGKVISKNFRNLESLIP